MQEREQIYLQKYSFDCGAGAAGIVLRIFGERVNHRNLMMALGVRRDGTQPTSLENYFNRRGFVVFCKENASIADLRRERNKGRYPIVLYQGSGTKKEIARYEGGHYSVVSKVSSRYIYLLDPGVDQDYGDGIGRQALQIPEFRNRWVDRWKERGKEIYSYAWMLSIGRPRGGIRK